MANKHEVMEKRLQVAARQSLAAAKQHELATQARDELIVQALEEGVPLVRVSRGTGLTRARIYQIRDRQAAKQHERESAQLDK